MKRSIKMYTLVSGMLIAGMTANAQNKKDDNMSLHKHEISISYSDGTTLEGANLWGIGLADAITGTKRTDESSTGVFGVGYRYVLSKRCRLGLDLGFAKVASKITVSPDKTPSIKEKELNLLVLPAAEFIYLRRHSFELYGSAMAGVDFTRHHETGVTARGKEVALKNTKLQTDFAYQINPIGIRTGNSRISGFVEAGLGYKGFVTAGLSLKF